MKFDGNYPEKLAWFDASNHILEDDDPRALETVVKDQVILINGSDLQQKPIDWIWPGWLACGKLHVLAGDPGQGKTTIAMALAASVSSGGLWPDGTDCDVGNVLIWSGEDDPADTLLPRLIAAGADKANCYFVSGTRVSGLEQPFDPARDIQALEEQAELIGGIKLLVVDPVVSVITGNSHNNSEVRRDLQPLVNLASRLNAAVLGITHFNKASGGGNPALRVIGSVAFTGVARTVLAAAKVKQESGEYRRILTIAKANNSPDGGGFEYEIQERKTIDGINATAIRWGKAVQGEARELLADSTDQSSARGSAIEAAKEFLQVALAQASTPTKTIESECKTVGLSWATVRRASDLLNVIKTKGHEGMFYWRLPDDPF